MDWGLAMYHVLLVEPDDDFCLDLREAISGAGCRVTIVGSSVEATTALNNLENIDHVIVETFLPDGSGLVLAEDARRNGKAVLCSASGGTEW
jgi:CheY-like chemotaxis protein